MKRLFFLALVFTLLPSFALANLSPTEAPGHLHIQDSSGVNKINIRASLIDSLRTTNYKTSGRFYDNSTIIKLSFEGQLSPLFRFRGTTEVISDYTNRFIEPNAFNPYEGISYTKESDKTKSWSRFTSSLEYDLSFATLLAGSDFIKWGPAKRNSVILRGNSHIYRPWMDSTTFLFEPAPTPYFGYEFQVGPLTYTHHNAKLYHNKNTGKYLNAHRLKIELPFKIELGLSEVTVYGSTTEDNNINPNPDADSANRSFEWVYAIPFIPYMLAEPLLGDLDNNALAFDIRVQTLKNWEFYAELFFDDLENPLSMFDESWWGNKWAASIGFEAKGICVSSVCFSTNTEYTRVEPWVYTHHKGGGYTYQNYGSSLGTDLGPNSQEFYTRLDAEWQWIKLSTEASVVKRDTAFGGHIEDIHTPLSETTKKFLQSKTTMRYGELKASVLLSPWEWIWGRFGVSRYFGYYRGYRLESSLGLTW